VEAKRCIMYTDAVELLEIFIAFRIRWFLFIV
jgi:hypothetical protein